MAEAGSIDRFVTNIKMVVKILKSLIVLLSILLPPD